MSQQLRPPSFGSIGRVLYLKEDHRDLTVTVQAEGAMWKFPAHKLMLFSASSVLRNKLEDTSVNEIVLSDIIDITPATTETLLRYIYRGEMEIECWNEGIELLQAAFKLGVDDLVQKCGRFLEDVIYPSNVCYIYDKAASCSLTTLQDKCLKIILDAGFIVLRSDAFSMLSKACVMDIIASPDLNIDNEFIVFEALFKWARLECCRNRHSLTEINIINQVKPFLQHVCIDDMSDTDKSALPPPILSCVKPNNRNRIAFCIPDSLFTHSFEVELGPDNNVLDMITQHTTFFRLSIDSPMFIIGLRFMFVASMIPEDFRLTLVKENTPKVTLFTHNISSTSIKTTQIYQRMWHEADIVLRQPYHLRPNDVYHFFLLDEVNDIQCPRTGMPSTTLRTASGIIHMNVHISEARGITALYLIE